MSKHGKDKDREGDDRGVLKPVNRFTAAKLSERQRSFVIEYLRNGFNGERAAIFAGYNEDYARKHVNKIITNPDIFEHISKAYKVAEMTQLKETALTMAEKARILNQIIYDIVPRDGSEPKRQYYKDALKAIDHLNKMAGDYAPDRRLMLTVDATQKKLNEARKIYEEY